MTVVRRINRAALARLANISRAAVTRWFRSVSPDGWINVESRTLVQLASALEISPESLLRKIPELGRFRSRFLWDQLYPTMEDFTRALIEGRTVAIARLVQIVGFRDAVKIVGTRVVSLFKDYKKQIKPARRRELEIIWPLYRSQT